MGIESLFGRLAARRIRRRFGRAFAFALGMLVLSLRSSAQSSSGRILGDVRDQSDAAIVGANVVITDVQRGVSRTLVTDSAGEYRRAQPRSRDLQDHRNEVWLQSASSAPIFNWKSPATLRIDVVLQPGDTTQTIDCERGSAAAQHNILPRWAGL